MPLGERSRGEGGRGLAGVQEMGRVVVSRRHVALPVIHSPVPERGWLQQSVGRENYLVRYFLLGVWRCGVDFCVRNLDLFLVWICHD